MKAGTREEEPGEAADLRERAPGGLASRAAAYPGAVEVLTYRAVEGESEVRTLCSANVPGEVGDWTETPRTAIVRAFVDGVADDGYGSPPDIVVADAFAWVVAPLAARIPKAFKRAPRAPNAWLKSTAPARKERARPAREAAAARAKQKRR